MFCIFDIFLILDIFDFVSNLKGFVGINYFSNDQNFREIAKVSTLKYNHTFQEMMYD